jgi:hypothetical protein
MVIAWRFGARQEVVAAGKSKSKRTILPLHCVFPFCFEKNGNLGICTTPKPQKILVSLSSLRSISLLSKTSGQLQVRERAYRIAENDDTMIEHFLKVRGHTSSTRYL